MTPLQIAIGGLGLMVGLLALAQRLGNWQNKPLARCLNIITAGLFVVWCFLLFPSWAGWAATAVVWSICLWFIFTWTRKPTAPLDPAEHPHAEFQVTRKNARYDPGRKYPLKVYIELMNHGNACGEVEVSRWISGIKAKVEPNVLQLWLGSDWYPVEHGVSRLHIARGQRCRLWIAPLQTQYTQEELQKRCDETALGTLAIRVDGQERELLL